jgi:hypothetical protein
MALAGGRFSGGGRRSCRLAISYPVQSITPITPVSVRNHVALGQALIMLAVVRLDT